MGKAPPGPLPTLLLCPQNRYKVLLFGVGMWTPAPGQSVRQGLGFWGGGVSALRDPNGHAFSSAWNWSWWWHPEVAWANETLPGQGCGAEGTGCPSPIREAQGAGDVAMGGRRASQSWRGAERGAEPQNAR